MSASSLPKLIEELQAIDDLDRPGVVDDARALLASLEALAPEHDEARRWVPLAHSKLGYALWANDAYDDALPELESARQRAQEVLEAGDDDARQVLGDAARGLGHVLFDLARYDEALEALARAQADYDQIPDAHRPDDHDEVVSDLHELIGRVQLALGNPHAAVEHLGAALELFHEATPDYVRADCLHVLGVARLEADDLEGARDALGQCVALLQDLFEDGDDEALPELAKASNNLGQAHLRLTDPDAAVSWFERAVDVYAKLTDDSPDAEDAEQFVHEAEIARRNLDEARKHQPDA